MSMPYIKPCTWVLYGTCEPFYSQVPKIQSPYLLKRKCISEVLRIDSIIIFHLSKLWKVKFFPTVWCNIFWWGCRRKFDIDHSWEWAMKGQVLHTVWCNIFWWGCRRKFDIDHSWEWAMKGQVLHTVWCNISGEAADEIWHWSLLGVSYERPSSPYCVMSYFWWGCRRNLTLITLVFNRRVASPSTNCREKISENHWETKGMKHALQAERDQSLLATQRLNRVQVCALSIRTDKQTGQFNL